jgi:hypothetical protein
LNLPPKENEKKSEKNKKRINIDYKKEEFAILNK